MAMGQLLWGTREYYGVLWTMDHSPEHGVPCGTMSYHDIKRDTVSYHEES